MKNFIIALIIALVAVFSFPQDVYTEQKPIYGIDFGEECESISIENFEYSCGKHDMYIVYVNDEKQIPLTKILNLYHKGKKIVLSFSPQCNMELCARTLGRLNIEFIAEICPLFSNCNLDKEEYISLFQNASAAFRKYAPKSKTLYSFSLNNVEKGEEYFPGSYYTDITGFMLYSTQNKNILFPVLQTEEAYNAFKSKTSVMISRFAVSHYSSISPNYETSEAAEFIKNYYTYVYSNFPEINAIIYSSVCPYVNMDYFSYINDYKITEPKELASLYKQIVTE